MTEYNIKRNIDGYGKPTGFYHDGTQWYAITEGSIERKSLNQQVLSSSARTTSGDTSTDPIDSSNHKEASFFLDVTSVSGTSPTLDVSVKTYDSTSGKWFNVASFSQATALTQEMITMGEGLGEQIAVFYTIGGDSPSFTFSVGSILKT